MSFVTQAQKPKFLSQFIKLRRNTAPDLWRYEWSVPVTEPGSRSNTRHSNVMRQTDSGTQCSLQEIPCHWIYYNLESKFQYYVEKTNYKRDFLG